MNNKIMDSLTELQNQLQLYKQKELKIKEQRKKSKERPEYKKQQNAYQKVYQKKYYHLKKKLSLQKIEKQPISIEVNSLMELQHQLQLYKQKELKIKEYQKKFKKSKPIIFNTFYNQEVFNNHYI
jgi:hypothetical protein